MKLIRYGLSGQENPGIIDSNGDIRDLRGEITDISGETFSHRSWIDFGR